MTAEYHPVVSRALGRAVSIAEIADAGGLHAYAANARDRNLPPAVWAALEWGQQSVREAPAPAASDLIDHPDKVYSLMRHLAARQQEELWVLLLTERKRLVHREMIYRGTLNSASVRIPEILRPAIVHGAAGMVLCHNHPSGYPEPSTADLAITRRARECAHMMDLALDDHVVIGDGCYCSMRLKGLCGAPREWYGVTAIE